MILYLKNIDSPYVCTFDIEHDQGKLIQFAGILFKKVGNNLYQVCRSINIYMKQTLSSFIQDFVHYEQDFINNYGIDRDSFIKSIDTFFDGIDKKDITISSHGVHQDKIILKDNGINLDGCNVMCTYVLAKNTLGRTKNLSLHDISIECACGNLCEHNAYGDAFATACVLSYLLKQKE